MAKKSGSSSPTNIEVDKTTLGRILKSRRLVVPGFQREYSWQQHRVKKLFSDFQAAMTKGQDSYFLGTIVFQGTNPPSVIDGQQRLATTCIFLAAVRDAYLSLGATDEAKSITDDFLFIYDRDVKESLPRLLLNIDDREYIKNSVLLQPADRLPALDRKEVHSHRLIDKAFACSRERVQKIMSGAMNNAGKIEELNAWVDFVEHKAVVVALTPPSLSQAYQMFITLNDRAQRTTQADLIKSHLFQEVSEGETDGPHIAEACAKWASARKQTDVGVPSQDDPILSYLRYLCVIRTGPVTIDGLFDVVENGIRGRTKALYFLDAMSACAKPYRAAIGDHPQFWDDKTHQLSKLVDHCVKNMGVQFPIPLFLSIGIKFSDKEAALALRAIESWCARLVITAAQRTGQAERGFGSLAHRIHKGEIKTAEHLIREAEATIVPPDSTFQEKFRTKTLSSKRQARFFLLELEAQIRADGGDAFAVAIDEPDRLSLEHILPTSRAWAVNYKKFTQDERDASVSKIGNLALVKKASNGQMGDSAFSAKLPVLVNHQSIKTTAVIGEFATDGDWTPEAIDARQVWLSELALKRWPLFSGKGTKKKKTR
jgi:Protein of unknown function DUF262/Protein of unknown function (DUF1524)